MRSRFFISMCRGKWRNPPTPAFPGRFIRQRMGDQAHFWPFDGWDIPSGRSAIVEVYPALWSRSFAREGRTSDQHDAYSIAAWLSRADRDGSLGAMFKPELSPPERTVAQAEGWILGVPGLIREGQFDHAGTVSGPCDSDMFRLH